MPRCPKKLAMYPLTKGMNGDITAPSTTRMATSAPTDGAAACAADTAPKSSDMAGSARRAPTRFERMVSGICRSVSGMKYADTARPKAAESISSESITPEDTSAMLFAVMLFISDARNTSGRMRRDTFAIVRFPISSLSPSPSPSPSPSRRAAGLPAAAAAAAAPFSSSSPPSSSAPSASASTARRSAASSP